MFEDIYTCNVRLKVYVGSFAVVILLFLIREYIHELGSVAFAG